MKDMTARYYLQVYRLKLEGAHASPAGLEFFKQLIAALEGMDANAPIRLETTHEILHFTDARSGLLLAKLPIGAVV